jgi:hypothetical protein
MVDALIASQAGVVLENLQYHKNEKIYDLAHYILTHYIQTEDEFQTKWVKRQWPKLY